LTEAGPVCAAHAGGTSSPAEAAKAAEEYLASHLDDVHTMTSMASDSAGGVFDWSGAAYQPVLLNHTCPNAWRLPELRRVLKD
jgi:hypothetical protein